MAGSTRASVIRVEEEFDHKEHKGHKVGAGRDRPLLGFGELAAKNAKYAKKDDLTTTDTKGSGN